MSDQGISSFVLSCVADEDEDDVALFVALSVAWEVFALSWRLLVEADE
jgi:hypothetical protein